MSVRYYYSFHSCTFFVLLLFITDIYILDLVSWNTGEYVNALIFGSEEKFGFLSLLL